MDAGDYQELKKFALGGLVMLAQLWEAGLLREERALLDGYQQWLEAVAEMLEGEGRTKNQTLFLIADLLAELSEMAATAGWEAFQVIDRLLAQAAGKDNGPSA